MVWNLATHLRKWAVAAGLIVGLLYLAYRVNGEMRAERLEEAAGDKIQSPRRTVDGVVNLGVEGAERYGFEEAPAQSVSWSERVPVYGQVVPNPRATVEIRAPFAGTLRAGPDARWPALGQWVGSGQLLGWVDIRISTQERLTLEDNLNSARLKKQGAEKVVRLQQERVNRVEKVLRSQIVPGQQLDDAKVLLADAETQLAIASAAVDLWQKALAEADRLGDRKTSTYSQALTAPADGEVVELAARPGMAIEAGGLVLRLVDFRRPLVRLDIPPELLADGPPTRVQLLSTQPDVANPSRLSTRAGAPEPAPITAVPVGPAPQVDEASQFVGYWYTTEVETSQGTTQAGQSGSPPRPGAEAVWRPGLFVKAFVTPPAARAQEAVAVPASAVLFHQGLAAVYVRVGPGAYQRREVRLLGREASSCILAPRREAEPMGLTPGDVVVSSGAQILLSEEFRGDVAVDADE